MGIQATVQIENVSKRMQKGGIHCHKIAFETTFYLNPMIHFSVIGISSLANLVGKLIVSQISPYYFKWPTSPACWLIS